MRGSAGSAAVALAVALSAATPAFAQIGNTGDVEATTADLERAAIQPIDGASGDPWEGFNRKMFAVNNAVDDIVFVPAAKVYRFVTPKPARRGLRNFLSNAGSAKTLINDILQGEFKRAGITTGRFIINSTMGFAGTFDAAAEIGIPGHKEDFGQTLAVWGAGPGPYLVLPILGPSSIRDGIGAGVDITFDPLFYVRTDAASLARYSRAGATAVSRREPLLEPLEDIEEKSLDYYASIRSFYMQARKREIANGRTNFEDLPDIGEYEEFDELE